MRSHIMMKNSTRRGSTIKNQNLPSLQNITSLPSTSSSWRTIDFFRIQMNSMKPSSTISDKSKSCSPVSGCSSKQKLYAYSKKSSPTTIGQRPTETRWNWSNRYVVPSSSCYAKIHSPWPRVSSDSTVSPWRTTFPRTTRTNIWRRECKRKTCSPINDSHNICFNILKSHFYERVYLLYLYQ
jgi:hypothetical protein